MAVLTPDSPDVLCHAAVRARNCSVLLASCAEPAQLAELRTLSGSYVSLTMSKVRAASCSSLFLLLAAEMSVYISVQGTLFL